MPAAASQQSAELLLALAALALGAAVLSQPDGAWAQAAQHTAAAVQQSAEVVHTSAQTARQEGSASAGLLRFFMVRRSHALQGHAWQCTDGLLQRGCAIFGTFMARPVAGPVSGEPWLRRCPCWHTVHAHVLVCHRLTCRKPVAFHRHSVA
jgi:hypothetical protein